MTNSRLTDPEVLESRFPVRIDSFAIRHGSGFAGQLAWRRRGGAPDQVPRGDDREHALGQSADRALRAGWWNARCARPQSRLRRCRVRCPTLAVAVYRLGLPMSEVVNVKQAVAALGQVAGGWHARKGRQAAHAAVRVTARRRRHTDGSRQSRPTSTVAIIHSSQASGLNAPPAKWLEPSMKV